MPTAPGTTAKRKATGIMTKARTRAAKAPPQAMAAGAAFVTHFIDKSGIVDVDQVADTFRMTKNQLAETVGLGVATMSKAERRTAPRTQSRVREMLEILSRIREWAGGETQAMAWYRAQPIPALDGRTPEALVKAGEAGAVRDYLDHLALGGFA
ncbi:MbcA/ParS/Xre antitoxin family protein [Novosphingobium sp. G106]|uniref:MbcA/ParS/Xre antitoxin family protein n=1 Tax=Novosphingobium sp. G106 TaxID=2849500 RepID=UPI0020C246D2|nr:MbcA/ParS/Xre antitoxin family protein [Novosphingobium sp. G106]